MLTGGEATAEAETAAPQQQTSQPETSGGIFSSSTLAALKNAKASVASKPAAAPSGPLVAYGSDSDDD
jgi:hypothetical protein